MLLISIIYQIFVGVFFWCTDIFMIISLRIGTDESCNQTNKYIYDQQITLWDFYTQIIINLLLGRGYNYGNKSVKTGGQYIMRGSIISEYMNLDRIIRE